MKIIYCPTRVLYSYSGLHMRLLHWVTWMTRRVTWRAPKLLYKMRRVTRARLEVTLQEPQIQAQVCTNLPRCGVHIIHGWKSYQVLFSNAINGASLGLTSKELWLNYWRLRKKREDARELKGHFLNASLVGLLPLNVVTSVHTHIVGFFLI